MANDRVQGLITKATGGFYYVKTAGAVVECRARGLFRKAGTSPFVGDRVEIEDAEDGKGYIMEILPRKNSLIRPPVANIDCLAMVVSTVSPEPNTLVLDTMLAIASRQEIEPLILLTKVDLASQEALGEMYRRAGFALARVSSATGEGVEEVRRRLGGKTTVFSGNSGVGKSSLLNALYPGLGLSTGEISDKLGRGRHTTRHVELFPTQEGGFVADTPGFSAVELERMSYMNEEQLQYCFLEFEPFLLKCRFTGCSHTKEQGCAVLEAVEAGIVSDSRHQSYKELYRQLKNVKEWEKR